MDEPKLSMKAVHALMIKVLHRQNEDGDKLGEEEVDIVGLVRTFVFHKKRIEESAAAILELLKELPVGFMHSSFGQGGGGWSFLEACQDRHGNHWCDEQLIMESLFCMGVAIRRVAYLVPRELWGQLPGAVPYLVVFDGDIPSG